jgi:hypothetical protein
VDPLVRILDVVFWIVAAALVGALVYPVGQDIVVALMLVLVVWSGGITWYEFRMNPLQGTAGGGRTRRQRFWASIFTVSVFVAFIYILTLIF